MFSVPGRYAGGAQADGKYTWVQTLHEVQLKAPVPPA